MKHSRTCPILHQANASNKDTNPRSASSTITPKFVDETLAMPAANVPILFAMLVNTVHEFLEAGKIRLLPAHRGLGKCIVHNRREQKVFS